MKPLKPSDQLLEHLRENYRYDPETGEFWRRAGHQCGGGYQTVAGRIGAGADGIRWAMKGHRLAHFLMTGTPLGEDEYIDHINGERGDNRWANLRVCTVAENARNRKPWGKVKSRGVTLVKGRKVAYRAVIGTYPNQSRLGDFETEAEAASAYNEAARARYGEFAKLNP